MKTTLKLLAVLHIMIVYLLWASEWNGMKSKKEDPPRLIAVLSSQGALQNIYVVGAGQKLETKTFLLQDRFLKLLCAYYAWDAIPQFFFYLLGFIQHHVLGDKNRVHYFRQLSKVLQTFRVHVIWTSW